MKAGTRALVYSMLILGAAAYSTPLIWTICTSLKTNEEIAHEPNRLLPHRVTLENFPAAWHALPFVNYVVNTLFVTLCCTLATVFSAALVAYGFARFKFRGRNTLFFLMLATMMLPSQVTMIPVFLLWKQVHAIDTYLPLTVPSLFGGAFNIFLLRQFFMGIPRELDEAMLLDGCGYFGIWRKLILPLSTPALIAVVLFTFIGSWDNFEGPLIYLSNPDNYTLSIGLDLFHDQYSTNQGQLMAATLVHIVPMLALFLVAQKFFIRGANLSGLGGR